MYSSKLGSRKEVASHWPIDKLAILTRKLAFDISSLHETSTLQSHQEPQYHPLLHLEGYTWVEGTTSQDYPGHTTPLEHIPTFFLPLHQSASPPALQLHSQHPLQIRSLSLLRRQAVTRCRMKQNFSISLANRRQLNLILAFSKSLGSTSDGVPLRHFSGYSSTSMSTQGRHGGPQSP